MVKIEAVKMEYKEIATPLYVRHLLECQEDIIKYDPLEILINVYDGEKILIKRKAGKSYTIKFNTKDGIICGKVSDIKSYITEYSSVDTYRLNGSPVEVIYTSGDDWGGYSVKSDLPIRDSYLISILRSIHLFDLLTRYESEGYIKIK